MTEDERRVTELTTKGVTNAHLAHAASARATAGMNEREVIGLRGREKERERWRE